MPIVEPIYGMRIQFEKVTTFTPLGIRFWDPARNIPVRYGLEVTARPATALWPITTAFRTASGVYAFQGLPGLHDLEHSNGDRALTSPPDSQCFTIQVKDLCRRFLPIAFDVDLPLPYKGLFRPTFNSSPPENSSVRFYLFSAPARLPVPGLAVVRANLVNQDTKSPAAHAVLETWIKGRRWCGIADERGSVAILLPYPTFIGTLGSSPPGVPPSQQQWELTVRVRYNPAALPPRTGIPRLRDLFSQPFADIWLDAIGQAVPEWSDQLVFGQELVVRTGKLSALWVLPRGSPP